LVGKSSLELIDGPERERALGWVAETIERGRVHTEYTGLRKDGSPLPVELSATLLQNDDGSARGFAWIARDITRRKRSEGERERLDAGLRRSQKIESIGLLAGGVAHDFNNLLTVINGYNALMLAGMERGDPLRRSAVEISKAGERAAGLTGQLLAFSRKQVIGPKPCNWNREIADSKDMLAQLAPTDIQIETDLDPGLGDIPADPGQMHQVLMNLVVNARDAMPNGGRFTIRTENLALDEEAAAARSGLKPGAYVALRVTDTGKGMSEEVRQRVFEPFFTTKGIGEGTGLGLAVVSRHRGAMWRRDRGGKRTQPRIFAHRVVAADGCSPAGRGDRGQAAQRDGNGAGGGGTRAGPRICRHGSREPRLSRVAGGIRGRGHARGGRSSAGYRSGADGCADCGYDGGRSGSRLTAFESRHEGGFHAAFWRRWPRG
jgi:signal transduction histidine kinase